ncbi:MAG: RidA family protein [Chloroflexota bacterium]
MKERIHTSGAPKALGPYSQAIATEGLLFCSGQGAVDPESGQFIGGDIAEQTERTLKNLGAVLEAAELGYEAVVKTTCFLADMDDFQAFNEVYARFFPEPYPARSTIQAARLPLDIAVEIEAIAQRS